MSFLGSVPFSTLVLCIKAEQSRAIAKPIGKKSKIDDKKNEVGDLRSFMLDSNALILFVLSSSESSLSERIMSDSTFIVSLILFSM